RVGSGGLWGWKDEGQGGEAGVEMPLASRKEGEEKEWGEEGQGVGMESRWRALELFPSAPASPGAVGDAMGSDEEREVKTWKEEDRDCADGGDNNRSRGVGIELEEAGEGE
ncbi:unnamed protein product, partial [Discosporangium mesarthrocarpum]